MFQKGMIGFGKILDQRALSIFRLLNVGLIDTVIGPDDRFYIVKERRKRTNVASALEVLRPRVDSCKAF